MSNGILYIATGEDYRREAIVSAQSVRNEMPSIRIGIIADSRPSTDVFDDVIIIEEPDYSFTDQIHHLSDSPYDRTIYLDTDIHVEDSISELYRLLDEFDIGLAHAQGGTSWEVDGVPASFPEYNSGVVIYNTDIIDGFSEDWLKNYAVTNEDRPQNQPSLRKTLYESDLRIATLPREYNCMYRQPGHVNSLIKIFHGRLIKVDGPGAGMYHDPYDAINKLNQYDQSRVFIQLGGLTVHTNRSDSLLHQIRLSIRQRGIKYTVRRGIQKVLNHLKNA
jgi:hypothetical protein